SINLTRLKLIESIVSADSERAALDERVAGIVVDARQCQRSGADLRQSAGPGQTPRIGRVRIVRTRDEVDRAAVAIVQRNPTGSGQSAHIERPDAIAELHRRSVADADRTVLNRIAIIELETAPGNVRHAVVGVRRAERDSAGSGDGDSVA